MADKQDLGTTDPGTKPPHLQEVEEDAVYLTNKRFKEAEEERVRKESQEARQNKKG